MLSITECKNFNIYEFFKYNQKTLQSYSHFGIGKDNLNDIVDGLMKSINLKYLNLSTTEKLDFPLYLFTKIDTVQIQGFIPTFFTGNIIMI